MMRLSLRITGTIRVSSGMIEWRHLQVWVSNDHYWCPYIIIRELNHVGRQHDGQNKFLQINDGKTKLSYIIIRMNLIQYKKLKTLALCLGRVLLNGILNCTCYGLKCKRCIKDVKISDLPL
jgi:hypothetical protein